MSNPIIVHYEKQWVVSEIPNGAVIRNIGVDKNGKRYQFDYDVTYLSSGEEMQHEPYNFKELTDKENQ